MIAKFLRNPFNAARVAERPDSRGDGLPDLTSAGLIGALQPRHERALARKAPILHPCDCHLRRAALVSTGGQCKWSAPALQHASRSAGARRTLAGAVHCAGRTASCRGLQRGVAVGHASFGKGSLPVVRGAGQDAGSADPG